MINGIDSHRVFLIFCSASKVYKIIRENNKSLNPFIQLVLDLFNLNDS